MALFRYLHDDAFLIFSRKFRFLYEAALLDIYEKFFSRGTYFPTPQEVIHAIYDVIKANPDFLAEGDDVGEGLPDVVSKRRRRIKFAGDAGEAAETALHLEQEELDPCVPSVAEDGFSKARNGADESLSLPLKRGY